MIRKRKENMTEIDLDSESLKPIIETDETDETDSLPSLEEEMNPIKQKLCCLLWWIAIVLMISFSAIIVAICILYKRNNIHVQYNNGTTHIDIDLANYTGE